jgi:glycine hydroxymethyltransferase
MHVIAAKAVCFKEAMSAEFRTTSSRWSTTPRPWPHLHQARGLKWSPAVPTTICSCSSLIGSDITGKDADAALGRANITVNKNAVPNDPRSPFVTSGLRIGTPADHHPRLRHRRVPKR